MKSLETQILMNLPENKITYSPKIEDFFKNQPNFKPQKGSILDTRPSHRWFNQLQKCVEADTYIFQKVFNGRQSRESNIEGKSFRVFSSYDYLGLIGHSFIEGMALDAIREFGTGTGGVRLLTGTNQLHDQLEYSLSVFKNKPSAMAFSSGYLANIAAIGGLFDKRDLIFVDEFIHRSIIDAILAAGIPYKTFKHNDPISLADQLILYRNQYRRSLIIIEGVYSMDGDIPPLDKVVEIKEEFGAFLMVDEAHSIGVLGKTGKGIDEFYNISSEKIDLFTGSLSKAIPSNGGFIAASEEVIHYLKHGGAPFMFSAALSPSNTAAALGALKVIENEPWRVHNLWENTEYFIQKLKQTDFDTGNTQSPIIPIICGSNENAFQLSRKLYDAGFLATAVIYPAVPPAMSRLRLCCTAGMLKKDIDDFVQALQ